MSNTRPMLFSQESSVVGAQADKRRKVFGFQLKNNGVDSRRELRGHGAELFHRLPIDPRFISPVTPLSPVPLESETKTNDRISLKLLRTDSQACPSASFPSKVHRSPNGQRKLSNNLKNIFSVASATGCLKNCEFLQAHTEDRPSSAPSGAAWRNSSV